MARLLGWMRWAALVSASGTLLSGSCLPENFYSGLLGDTVVTGITSAVLNALLTNAGL